MIRNNKSRRTRAANVLTKYLKLKAIGKTAKGAGKTAKWTAYGKAAKSAAQRPPKKVWLAMAGGAGAAALGARKLRRTSSSGRSQPTAA